MKINEDFVPSTIEAAVDHIVGSLDDADRKHMVECDSASVHFGAGMAMRNSWSMWAPDSPLKRDAVEKYGIAHADDMSGLMWSWVWAKVRGDPFDPVRHCEAYHAHWKKCKTDSLTAGGWPPRE